MAHLTDLGFTLLELGKAVDDKRVRTQTHPEFPNLTIANYCEEVQFRNSWDKITLACRGLIFDQVTGEVIARPWEKFFNMGQRDNRIAGEAPVEVSDKLDGSLGILYRRPDGLYAIATRGSFASEQALEANKIWSESYSGLDVPEDYTFLFEILVPWNRIVLQYDYDSKYLQQGRGVLQARSPRNDTGEYLHSTEVGLEGVSSMQESGSEERQGEARGEAQAERSQLALSEQRESERTQGETLREDSVRHSGSQEGQAVRGLQSSVSSGVHGLRPPAGDKKEVQYRSGEESASTGRGNGEVRTGVRELPQNQNVHYTPGNLVLLGAVHKERGCYLGPEQAQGLLLWDGPVAETFKANTFVSALSLPDRKGKEGYIIRSGNKIVKLKQADYVELHRIVTNLSPRTIWEQLARGRRTSEICAEIPDEFHRYVENIADELFMRFSEIKFESSLEFQRTKTIVWQKAEGNTISRGLWAQEIKKCKYQSLLFMMLDNRPVDEYIWKQIKPRGDVPFVKDEG